MGFAQAVELRDDPDWRAGWGGPSKRVALLCCCSAAALLLLCSFSPTLLSLSHPLVPLPPSCPSPFLLQFDHSGKFLAIGSCEIAVHETKGWGKLVGFAEPNSNLTGVGFGAKAESIAGSSDAGVVKLYGPA